MTSIEWLEMQFEESHSYINEIFKETFEQAKEMHKQEMATNCSQQEISDEEIKKGAIDYLIHIKEEFTDLAITSFITGCVWYREQIKQKQVK
jgi:hypothetical protein